LSVQSSTAFRYLKIRREKRQMTVAVPAVRTMGIGVDGLAASDPIRYFR
jgi:hypothetical protein